MNWFWDSHMRHANHANLLTLLYQDKMNPTNMAFLLTQWKEDEGNTQLLINMGISLKYDDLAIDRWDRMSISATKRWWTNKQLGDNQSELHTLWFGINGYDPLISIDRKFIVAIYLWVFSTFKHHLQMFSTAPLMRTDLKVQKICVRKEQVSGQESHGGAAASREVNKHR